MYVLPVAEVLQLERFGTHEELRGRLVEYTAGMKVIFVTQTWLSAKHNDNSKNEKCQLLQRVLRRAMAGESKVEVRFEIVAHGLDKPLRVPRKRLAKDFANAYIWLECAH